MDILRDTSHAVISSDANQSNQHLDESSARNLLFELACSLTGVSPASNAAPHPLPPLGTRSKYAFDELQRYFWDSEEGVHFRYKLSSQLVLNNDTTFCGAARLHELERTGWNFRVDQGDEDAFESASGTSERPMDPSEALNRAMSKITRTPESMDASYARKSTWIPPTPYIGLLEIRKESRWANALSSWSKRCVAVRPDALGWSSTLKNAVLSEKPCGQEVYKKKVGPFRMTSMSKLERIHKVDEERAFVLKFRGDKEGEEVKFRAGDLTQRDFWIRRIATCALSNLLSSGSEESQESDLRSLELLVHLIDDCGGDVDVCDRLTGLPLVLVAATNNLQDHAIELLRRGANAKCLLRLDFARAGWIGMIMFLLQHSGRDLNVLGDDDEEEEELEEEGGLSLIHYLVLRREVNLVEKVLERVDLPTVLAKTKLRETALSLALPKFAWEDASIDEKRSTLIRMLVEKGADLNDPTGLYNESVFHSAIKYSDNARLAQMMYERFASQLDLNQPDCRGDAALHICMRMGALHLAKQIACDSRCDLNLRCASGDSSLVLAMKLNLEAFAVFLLTSTQKAVHAGNVKGTLKPMFVCDAKRRFSWGSSASNSSGSGSHQDSSSESASSHQLDAVVVQPSMSPLHLAIQLDMVHLATELALRSDVRIDAVDSLGRTCVHTSILNPKFLRVALILISKHAKSKALDLQDSVTGDTALHLAFRAGRLELACALLSAGADPTICNATGETCLHASLRWIELNAENPSSQVGGATHEILLAGLRAALLSGADMDRATLMVQDVHSALRPGAAEGAKACRFQTGKQTPLHRAVGIPNDACALEATRVLLAMRGDETSREDESRACPRDGSDFTVLGVALENENARVALYLLQRAASASFDPEVNKPCGYARETPLHLVLKSACDSGRKREMVQALLKRGAYWGKWCDQGLTPVHLAGAHDGNLEALSELLRHAPAALEARTESNVTPLLLAVQHSRRNATRLLLESGADVCATFPKNRRGVFATALRRLKEEFVDEQAWAVARELMEKIPLHRVCSDAETWARDEIALLLSSSTPSSSAGDASGLSFAAAADVVAVMTTTGKPLNSIENIGKLKSALKKSRKSFVAESEFLEGEEASVVCSSLNESLLVQERAKRLLADPNVGMSFNAATELAKRNLVEEMNENRCLQSC